MSIEQFSKTRLSQSERGMISIMTTMILIIVISLIVLGFAQLSRRNQRESLDRQLSTQAFYAAESGVNDAREAINARVASNQTVPEKNTCTGTAGGAYTADPIIDAAADVKYSCLLIDPTPTTLRYTDIGTNSVIVPMTATSGTMSTINLTWQSKITGNPMTGCGSSMPTLPTTSGWSCGYGVLRFDLVPASGTVSASGLATSAMTTFAVPVSSGIQPTTIPYAGAGNAANNGNNNVKEAVTCTATNCSLTINGLSQSSYYMRISSLYRNVSLQIKATNNLGSAVEIEGAQALIDATGRAQDVLRRVQVSVPLRANSKNQVSDYAIQSTDSICKRFSVMDNYFSSDITGVTSSSRLCQP